MIIRELSKVTNAPLHDAIYLAELKGYKFLSLYIDRDKECAITFKGEIPEEEIKRFFFNINPNVTCDSEVANEEVVYNRDYDYSANTTSIYTRDGWKY